MKEIIKINVEAESFTIPCIFDKISKIEFKPKGVNCDGNNIELVEPREFEDEEIGFYVGKVIGYHQAKYNISNSKEIRGTIKIYTEE